MVIVGALQIHVAVTLCRKLSDTLGYRRLLLLDVFGRAGRNDAVILCNSLCLRQCLLLIRPDSEIEVIGLLDVLKGDCRRRSREPTRSLCLLLQ